MQLLILTPLHCLFFFSTPNEYFNTLLEHTSFSDAVREKRDYVGKIPKRRTPYLCLLLGDLCMLVDCKKSEEDNLWQGKVGGQSNTDDGWQMLGIPWQPHHPPLHLPTRRRRRRRTTITTTTMRRRRRRRKSRCLVFLGSPTTHPSIYPGSIKRSRNTHSFLGSKEKGLAFELRFTFWGGLVVGPSLIAEISAVSYAIDLNFSSWKVLRFAIICCRPNKTALFFSFVTSALTTQLIWLLNFQSTKFCPDSSHILFHHSFV